MPAACPIWRSITVNEGLYRSAMNLTMTRPSLVDSRAEFARATIPKTVCRRAAESICTESRAALRAPGAVTRPSGHPPPAAYGAEGGKPPDGPAAAPNSSLSIR